MHITRAANSAHHQTTYVSHHLHHFIVIFEVKGLPTGNAIGSDVAEVPRIGGNPEDASLGAQISESCVALQACCVRVCCITGVLRTRVLRARVLHVRV